MVFDCLGGNTPPPERNTAWNKGRKYFHCLGAPNNLIRPWRHNNKVAQNQVFLPSLTTNLCPKNFHRPACSSHNEERLFAGRKIGVQFPSRPGNYFWRSWNRASLMYISSVPTRCIVIQYSLLLSMLYVSGGFSAHHQELKTVHAASGTCQACLLLPLAWMSWNSPSLAVAASKLDIYLMLCVQFWAGRRNRL